jgi:hypothetical protein
MNNSNNDKTLPKTLITLPAHLGSKFCPIDVTDGCPDYSVPIHEEWVTDFKHTSHPSTPILSEHEELVQSLLQMNSDVNNKYDLALKRNDALLKLIHTRNNLIDALQVQLKESKISVPSTPTNSGTNVFTNDAYHMRFGTFCDLLRGALVATGHFGASRKDAEEISKHLVYSYKQGRDLVHKSVYEIVKTIFTEDEILCLDTLTYLVVEEDRTSGTYNFIVDLKYTKKKVDEKNKLS